jgi:hypothetical protein
MKEILVYFRHYISTGNKKVWLLTTLVLAVLVLLNYSVGIESAIKKFPSTTIRFLGFFLLYTFIFTTCYGIQFVFSGPGISSKKYFFSLLFLCPLIFAAKISVDISDFIINSTPADPWNKYWQMVLNWPLKCIIILFIIAAIWHWHRYSKPVAGLNKNLYWKPYLLLLLCAVPLILIASSMVDFQSAYPKLKRIAFIYPYTNNDFIYNLMFELSYGSDFLTIEAFFRGFVVLAFIRYAGKDAILPMAAFYCTIHFGKPLFECITSYIGGVFLGVIVYNTRSIWGGFIVHLGMAWLMDAFTIINAN